MNTSAQTAFDRGLAFLQAHARPLDRARMEHRLGRGPASAVVEALAAYQNPDGGFGHGLEPDLATPASTAIATSVAFQALREAGVGVEAPMVGKALAWLEGAFDEAAGVWPIIGPQVDLAPHAFWWDWDEGLAERWNGFRFNPSIELLGVLYACRSAASGAVIARAEAALLADLERGRRPTGAYDIKCGLRLLGVQAAPAAVKARVEAALRETIAALSRDDEHAPPLDLAPAPDAPLADLMSDRIESGFEALLAAQQPDGGWLPFWDWSAVDAGAWRAAERDWRGVLTRQALEALLAYGLAVG